MVLEHWWGIGGGPPQECHSVCGQLVQHCLHLGESPDPRGAALWTLLSVLSEQMWSTAQADMRAVLNVALTFAIAFAQVSMAKLHWSGPGWDSCLTFSQAFRSLEPRNEID